MEQKSNRSAFGRLQDSKLHTGTDPVCNSKSRCSREDRLFTSKKTTNTMIY